MEQKKDVQMLLFLAQSFCNSFSPSASIQLLFFRGKKIKAILSRLWKITVRVNFIKHCQNLQHEFLTFLQHEVFMKFRCSGLQCPLILPYYHVDTWTWVWVCLSLSLSFSGRKAMEREREITKRGGGGSLVDGVPHDGTPDQTEMPLLMSAHDQTQSMIRLKATKSVCDELGLSGRAGSGSNHLETNHSLNQQQKNECLVGSVCAGRSLASNISSRKI